MKLAIEHRTAYRYDGPVRASKNEVRMTPASTPRQQVILSALEVNPAPSHRSSYRDYFGILVECFEVTPPHDVLEAIQSAVVSVEAHPEPSADLASSAPETDGAEYSFASPMVALDSSVLELASSLRAGDALATVRSVLDWMREEMTYETGQTVVGTSVAELLSTRRGVCQDFAHLCCALLRANEVPARYVSGYFAPRPLEPGESVDAQSHAWVEALLPRWGWWAVDPTNHLTTTDRHVKVGHGRDYSDIVPFQGVHVGSAAQTLEVSVSIRREA